MGPTVGTSLLLLGSRAGMGSACSLASGPSTGSSTEQNYLCFYTGGENPHQLTCIRESAGLRDPWGQDTDSLDRDVQGFLFTAPGAGWGGGGETQKSKVKYEGPKGGGNFGEGNGGRGSSRVVLTGVRVSSEPVTAHGGWAARSLREAMGTLGAGAAGTSALPFWSLLGDNAEGLRPCGAPSQGK